MNPVTGLSLARIGIGAVAFANPDLAGKLFRLDPSGNPQSPYLSRLFGSRDVLLGVLTLAASGSTRRNLVLAGMAVDGADAVAGYLAGRDGSVGQTSSAFLTAPAVMAVVAGAVGLRR